MGTRIPDPVPFDPWIRYPGWGKNQDPDDRIRDPVPG
jgi:hypothetical protein